VAGWSKKLTTKHDTYRLNKQTIKKNNNNNNNIIRIIIPSTTNYKKKKNNNKKSERYAAYPREKRIIHKVRK